MDKQLSHRSGPSYSQHIQRLALFEMYYHTWGIYILPLLIFPPFSIVIKIVILL